METKKITLRSQTVKCPHCGEYYSVTYKYCPFCDAGRQEEERRLAEKRRKSRPFSPTPSAVATRRRNPRRAPSAPPKPRRTPRQSRRSSRRRLSSRRIWARARTCWPPPRPRPEVALRNERNPRAFDAEGVEIPLEEIKPKAHRERSGQPAHGTKTAHSGKNGKRKKPAPEPEQPELTTPIAAGKRPAR
ncbi:MAG: hypothetical protein ACLUNZ_06405 [Evtepia sp.]